MMNRLVARGRPKRPPPSAITREQAKSSEVRAQAIHFVDIMRSLRLKRERRKEFNERITAIAGWSSSLISKEEIARIGDQLGELGEWARRELEHLVEMPLSDARARLDEIALHRTDDWPTALDLALADWRDMRYSITEEDRNSTAQDGLAAEIDRRKKERDDKEALESERRRRASGARFFAQFEGKNDAEVRAAVRAYVLDAERERSWRATLRTLGDALPGSVSEDRLRPHDIALTGVLDLSSKIDEHVRDVNEGRERERLLSVSAERKIRRALADYVNVVKANRRRDRRNAWWPIAAFLVGFFGGLAGDTDDIRRSGMFESLTQVLPVLLLALSVEVRFLADRGVVRALTAATLLLVSLGFSACLFVLVTDTVSPVLAGLCVGAAAAGLSGLIAAVLWRPAGLQVSFQEGKARASD